VAFFGVRVGGEGTGPGDVTVADGVQGVAAFAESPLVASEAFSQGEIIGSDVRLISRDSFLYVGKLIHESGAEVMFLAGEIHLEETGTKLIGGFPTDLFSESGFIASGLDVAKITQEVKQGRFEKVPILGATSQQGAKPELIAFLP
jgi:hypothetical protein